MNFLKVSKKYSSELSAKNTILCVPYEHTTSYVKGCSKGPDAIVEASGYVELYDNEFDCRPHFTGIYTTGWENTKKSHEDNLQSIGDSFLSHINSGQFTVVLGGEHSITIGILAKLLNTNPDISVLQFDAHADLRESYQGSKFSHACVMRRVHELTNQIAHAGVRSLSSDEAGYIKKNSPNILYANSMHRDTAYQSYMQLSKTLTDKVYITFDVDFFSTSVITSTGTPEPGGLEWYKTLEILRMVFENHNVVGMDIVELIGNPDDHISAFNAALLAKKCITYKHFAKRQD